MKKKQVFISYKSEEFDEALWVKNQLETQGITCWMAPMCITGGASYAAEIPAAINNCTVFVLILSEKVQQSKWVPRELDQAINAGKTIMPFMLEDCELKDEFKFYLSNIQRYYAYQDKLGTMQIMSREIRSILGIPEPPAEDVPAAPAQPAEAPKVPSPAEAPRKAAPKKEPAPKPQKAAKKKKPWILPVILAAVVAMIAIPVLAILLTGSGSEVTFAGTDFKKKDSTLQVENATVTAEDLQVLSEFEELRRVILKDCILEADDLSAFSSHPLWELTLEGCDLTDLRLRTIDFESLDLITLNLSRNGLLKDLSPIAPLADTLSELHIGSTGVTDLEALKGFTALNTLSAENLGLETLEPLGMAVYLETLNADGNKLADLKGLENTTILRTVSLKENNLQQVDCLTNSAATLQYLYLDNNHLNNLDVLSGCTAIREFSADHNRLESIDWATGWTQLTRLSASNNQLKDEISTPPKSDQIHFLDLSGNQLTGFRGFVFDPDVYATVDLSDNSLNDIQLPTDGKYKRIDLHGNPLTHLGFAEGLDGISLSVDYFEGLDAETVKSISFSDFYIIDCPANHIVELEQASSRAKLLNGTEVATVLPDPEFPEY